MEQQEMTADRRSLTRLAHERLSEVLGEGDWAIDATAGNGHDTLFLARAVGPSGRLAAFDIQEEAIANTHQRLAQEGLPARVVLHQAGHERMAEQLGPGWRGRAAAVTFNLGYLPGGDHAKTTLPMTTLAALDQALALLRAGGLLSVIAYRGHPGGKAEADAVTAWFERHAETLKTEIVESPGPVLLLGRKK
ncbi:MAG: methyltransferase domain-containing protein [Gammaproteobacteria bacterium]|nr:MAG: methyltransferase domain-containing protein [Gammaproteobacteria bacterium]